MYFIILIVTWYVSLWLGKHSTNLANVMHYQQKPFSQGIWGILVHAIKGFTLGYTLWLFYYCFIRYTGM